MANKKTTHKKSYPKIHPQAYQFGGLSFLEPYENLTKQWDNFWRGGDYFKSGYNPSIYNYDPQNPTVNDPWGTNLLEKTVKQNENAVNSYKSAINFNKNYKGYIGNNSEDAFKFYQNQHNDKYKNSFDAFNNYDNAIADIDSTRKIGYNNDGSTYFYTYDTDGNQIPWVDPVKPEGYDAYKNFDAAKQWRDDKISYDGNAANLSDAKNRMSQGFSNTVGGIFSGLNYINSYVPPEKINLQQGSKGVMYQDGGLVKGPGMMFSPMMQEFGGVKVPTSKWTHFPNGSSAISALDSMLTSGRSKIYKENMSLAEAMANYDPRLGNTAGKFSKYTIKDLKKDPKLKDEFLYHLIKNEVSAQDFNQYYAPAFTDRAVGPSTMNYQVTSRQDGGNVNLTGYTPGTETMANPMNEIPSGDITMEKTPIDLLAIGKGGAHHGFLEILKANSKEPNKYTKVKSTIEIPLEQQKQEVLMAKYGKLINNINRYNTGDMQFGGMINAIIEGNNAGLYGNYTPEQAAYLNQMSGEDPNSIEHYSRATPEFNARMLQGFNQVQAQPKGVSIPMLPTINPSIVEPMSGLGFNIDKMTAEMGVNSGVRLKKGGTQKVAAYQQMLKANGYDIEIDGAWGPKTQAAYEAYTGKKAPSKTAVISGKAKVGSNINKAGGISNNYIPNLNTNYGYNGEIAKLFSEKGIPLNGENIDTYYKGTLNTPSNNSNSSNIAKTTQSLTTPLSEKGQQDAYTKYYANPNNRYNGPQFGPPVGTLSEDEQKEIRDWQIATISMVPGGRLAVSGIVKGATYLPKVGKAVQYGANYIDEAGNIVSAAGSKLGKAPKAAIDATKQFFKVGSKPNMYDDILAGKVNAAGKYIDPITKRFTTAPVDTRGTLQRVFQDRTFSTSFKNTLNDVISTGRKLSQKAYKALTPAEKNAYDAIIKKGLDSPLYANPAYNPGAARAFHVIPKQYGGYVPKFQYGGSVNDQHAIPVFSSNLEDFGLTELQTEKDEIAYMPDGSLPDVKAKKLHKHQDNHDVTDIMQSGTYIFSNDPKMKFSIKSKIGGVELGDMKLGRSVFKYVENEISEGPKDIMLKDMFFNNSKKELTTAEIAKNIKKNLPIVDMKNDYFADRAIEENKDQRMEYLSILKAFNEYKKPKQRNIPKAQYGMPIQYSQNGLDGVMGYGDKQMDPFKRLDNNIISMFNYKQPELPSLPKPYQTGGMIPQAQFGFIADGIDYLGGWSRRAQERQERKNKILAAEAQSYRDQLQQGVDRSGTIGIGTNMATYAASLNVPLQRYDDQSEAMSAYNAAANRAVQRLEASKYTASQGIGAASSLARYSNSTNYGDYLAKAQAQSDSNIGKINQAIADLEMSRANQNIGFISARNAGRNQSLNARDTQLYNANVQGIGNVGRSMQEATFNSADTRYRLGSEKMAYDAYLEDKAIAVKQAKQQQIRGYADEIGGWGLTYLTGGFGGENLLDGKKKTTSTPSFAFTGSNPGAFQGHNFQNPAQMSPANQQFNPNYGGFTTYSTINPGGLVDRNGTILSINPITGRPWGQ